MKSKDLNKVFHSLTLLELMKNCSFPIMAAVATKDFLGTMKTLCTGKKGPQAQEKALTLLQRVALSDAYKYTLPPFFEAGQSCAEGALFPRSRRRSPAHVSV